MIRKRLLLSAVAVVSFLTAEFANADDVPRGAGGGFMAARIVAKRIKKMREQDNFSGADQNRDGRLDRKELETAKKTHDVAIDDDTFKKIDTNGDGMLSHEECEKFHKQMEKDEAKAKPDAGVSVGK